MSFYKSQVIEINKKPIILYLEKGIEKVLDIKKGEYLNILESGYTNNHEILKTGEFHIVILWNVDKDIMLDIWIFSDLDEWSNNPIIDVVNLRNGKRYFDQGVTAGDGLILLGEEEKYRKTTLSLINI